MESFFHTLKTDCRHDLPSAPNLLDRNHDPAAVEVQDRGQIELRWSAPGEAVPKLRIDGIRPAPGRCAEIAIRKGLGDGESFAGRHAVGSRAARERGRCLSTPADPYRLYRSGIFSFEAWTAKDPGE